MTAFTRLGASLWDWEPWTELVAPARILWLALYSSAEAKRHVPGLWQGGIPTMADAARMSGTDVATALEDMLAHEIVEYDAKMRVLRMCELPDCGEYPSNGKVIRGWWTRFKTVPQCPVRDAHIRTLRWIMDEGARRAGKAITEDHQIAWAGTFGTVPLPLARRRGVRTVVDSDTSTKVQPSLFAHPERSGNGCGTAVELTSPQGLSQAVDNSAALHQPNKIRGPETVSDTVSDTNRISDPGSRIPDLSFSSPDPESAVTSAPSSIARDPAPPLPVNEDATAVWPRLRVVPPFDASDVFAAIAKSGVWDRTFDKTHREAVDAMILKWAACGLTLDDFALYGQYVAFSRASVSAKRLLESPDLPTEIREARDKLADRDARLSMLAEFMHPKGGP